MRFSRRHLLRHPAFAILRSPSVDAGAMPRATGTRRRRTPASALQLHHPARNGSPTRASRPDAPCVERACFRTFLAHPCMLRLGLQLPPGTGKTIIDVSIRLLDHSCLTRGASGTCSKLVPWRAAGACSFGTASRGTRLRQSRHHHLAGLTLERVTAAGRSGRRATHSKAGSTVLVVGADHGQPSGAEGRRIES